MKQQKSPAISELESLTKRVKNGQLKGVLELRDRILSQRLSDDPRKLEGTITGLIQDVLEREVRSHPGYNSLAYSPEFWHMDKLIRERLLRSINRFRYWHYDPRFLRCNDSQLDDHEVRVKHQSADLNQMMAMLETHGIDHVKVFNEAFPEWKEKFSVSRFDDHSLNDLCIMCFESDIEKSSIRLVTEVFLGQTNMPGYHTFPMFDTNSTLKFDSFNGRSWTEFGYNRIYIDQDLEIASFKRVSYLDCLNVARKVLGIERYDDLPLNKVIDLKRNRLRIPNNDLLEQVMQQIIRDESIGKEINDEAWPISKFDTCCAIAYEHMRRHGEKVFKYGATDISLIDRNHEWVEYLENGPVRRYVSAYKEYMLRSLIVNKDHKPKNKFFDAV